MTDYSAMSDFEINKKVALKLGMDWSGVTEENRFFYQTADYCNNPADSWPIISVNLIGVEPIYQNGTKWLAHAGDDSEFRCVEASGLRAAMTVFLMMKDAE